ncbi:MAG: hypothetical protein ABL949_15555 [Fimbriimonadaceae bacterium]
MLFQLVLTLSVAQTVTLTSPGRPLIELLGSLQEVVPERLYVSAQLAETPVIVHLEGAPWVAVKRQLAEAVWGSWSTTKDGGFILTRSSRDDADRLALVRKGRAKQYEPYLRNLRKQTQSQLEPEFGSPDARVEKVRQSLKMVLARLGSTIMDATSGAIWTFPMMQDETAMPEPGRLALTGLFAWDQKRVERGKLTETAISQSAFVFDGDGMGTALFADSNGVVLVRERFGFGEISMDDRVMFRFGSDVKINLTTKSADYLNLFRSGEPATLTRELSDLLFDPVSVDPVEVVLGKTLVEIAKKHKWQLVACPPFSTTMQLARAGTSLTERSFLAVLSRSCEVALEPASATIRIRPNDVTAPVSRTKLKALLRQIRTSTSVDAVSSAAMGGLLDNTAPPWELFSYLAPVTGKIIASGTALIAQPPLWDRLALSTVAVDSLVTLTPAEQKQMAEFLESNPGCLSIPFHGAIEGEGGEVQQTLTYNESLRALPLRALKGKLGGKVRIIWKPGSQTSYRRTAPTEVFQDSKLCDSGDQGRPTDKWYWQYGISGGGLVFDFGHGVQVRTGMRIWAANPNSKAQQMP